MRIVVCARQIYAVDEELELNDDSTDVDPDFRDPGLSEWDQAAVEAALRLRDQGREVEIVLLSVAGDEADPILRRLLAMGADRARRIDIGQASIADPVAVAALLAEIVRDESPDLVLCGVQTADRANGATGGALAGLLDWPMLAVVKDFTLGNGGCRCECELEGGVLASASVRLPAVMSIQTGAFQPRYANLRAIKQAEQKEIVVSTASAPETPLKLRRMFVPEVSNNAEILGDQPADVARRIVELVQETRK